MNRRHLVGLAALLLLGTAIWLAWRGTASSQEQLFWGFSVRAGLVLAMIWLAWPDLARLSPFFLIAGGALLVVMLRWPKAALYFLPVLVLLWLLRPRQATQGPPDRRREERSGREDR